MVEGWTPLRWGLVGAIVVLIGAYLLMGTKARVGAQEEESGDSVAVVVARRYIPAFSAINPAQTTVRYFPKEYVPPGVLHSLAELSTENGLAIYGSAVAIPAGQPLTRSLISDLGRHHEMASLLPPGNVAVSFAVDSVRGVGGWIRPGDTIALFEVENELSGRTALRHSTRLLFSSVRVLAVNKKRVGAQDTGSQADEMMFESESDQVVTVVLNPVEAARLVAVREQGHLSAMLRPLGDDVPWAASDGNSHE